MSSTKLRSRSEKLVLKEIKRDIKKYEERGFRVTYIHGDNKFNNQSLIDTLEPINVHVYAKGEHIGFIENGVKTVKERTRKMCNLVPYTRYTVLMKQSVVEMATEMINAFS